MEGTVTKFASSRTGKAQIYIDEKMYYLGKCRVDGLEVGDRITFEASSFGERGDLWGLNKWGKLPGGNGYVPMARVESRPVHTTGSRDEPLTTKDVTIFVCGVVNNAIQAKTITEPEQIEKWVSAARNALKGQS